MKFQALLSCGVALGALLGAAGGALGADFTVRSGETAGGQALSNPGDVGLVEAGGTINTAGFGNGVMMNASNQSVTNNGDIVTSGAANAGIGSDNLSSNAQINNRGSITTSNVLSAGITSFGVNAQIENSGDIRTSGFNAYGIDSIGANAQIYNSGEIRTSGGSSYAIFAAGNGTTVTNSGRVISASSDAMAFGLNATLNLLAGSAIQGNIFFNSAATTATLNIGPGLNTALRFIGIPATIKSFGAPMVVDPGTGMVAVVDPTGFSAQDEMLTDLTRAISGAVDGRLDAARFGYVPMASAFTAYAEADTQPMAFGYATGTGAAASTEGGFWAAGIGSWRNQDADGPNVGFDTNLGGLMVGYDTVVAGGTRVGGFLGASTSRFETDANSQQIDADSYFGGLYAGFTGGNYFLDVSLTGGVSQQSGDRTVANNTVLGGIEHATADYDGVFVSPSATIGTMFAMANGSTFIPSFRARYAGLFLDSYEESGSAANLSVDDGDVNIFDLRAQLAYALAALPSGNGAFHTTFRIGADATLADNANVDAALLGTALNFDISGDDTVRGFAGIDLNYRTDGGSSFFLGADAGYDTGNAFTLDVQGGVRIPL